MVNHFDFKFTIYVRYILPFLLLCEKYVQKKSNAFLLDFFPFFRTFPLFFRAGLERNFIWKSWPNLAKNQCKKLLLINTLFPLFNLFYSFFPPNKNNFPAQQCFSSTKSCDERVKKNSLFMQNKFKICDCCWSKKMLCTDKITDFTLNVRNCFWITI